MLLQSRCRAVAVFFLFMARADIAAAQDVSEKLDLCMSCHGETGKSQMQGVPSLAGRPASDLVMQLRLFRNGQRQNPQMVMATRLTDAEIEALAAFFAKQASR
jgi:cytochrome c553